MSISNLFNTNNFGLKCASIDTLDMIGEAVLSEKVITGATNLTAADCCGTVIHLTGAPGAGFLLSVPSAADLVNYYVTRGVRPNNGKSLDLLIANNTTQTATLDAVAAGLTLKVSNPAIPSNSQKVCKMIFTNTAAGSEAVTCVI